jgi:hypothetical protein
MTGAHVSERAVSAGRELPDDAWQLAVLNHVLWLHPARLSAAELRREMLAGDPEFSKIDTHDRAVRDLVAAGLLRHDGDSVVPTRAALRFDVLWAIHARDRVPSRAVRTISVAVASTSQNRHSSHGACSARPSQLRCWWPSMSVTARA